MAIILLNIDAVLWNIFLLLTYICPRAFTCINPFKFIYPNESLINRKPEYSKVVELLRSGGRNFFNKIKIINNFFIIINFI